MDVLCGDDAYADICRFHATSGYLESTVDVTPGNNLAWPCVQLQWISGTWSM
jgi:hypothetical protein